MNKLITKIIGACLGMSMAVGVGIGVAVGTNSKNATEAEAATITTWTRVTSVSTLTGGGTFIMGYEATANSGTIVPLRSDGANATTTANGFFHTGTTSGSSTNGTITVTQNASYTAYELYITASTNTSGAINIQMGSSSGNYYGASSGGTSKNTGRLYTSGNTAATDITVSVGSNGLCSLTSAVTGSYKYMTYNTSSPRYAFYSSAQTKTVFYKKGTQSTSDPTISLSSDSETISSTGSASITVTYSDLTSSLNVLSDDTDVATVSLASSVSSGSGSVVMTITGQGEGTAEITVSSTGATSKTVDVTVYEEQEFTLITMSSQLVDGGHYLIAKTGTSTIMSNTQNSNNRGITTATPAGPSDFSTLTTENADAAVLTFTADGDYFTMYDPDNSGYLCYESGGNYLRTGTAMTDGYYWSISFTDDHAIIENKGYSSYHIRNNGNIMACYTTTQTHVDLYLLTSELPSEKTISSFTMPSESISFENLESYTFTAQYSPSDASETVTASIQTGNVGSVTFGTVNMSNGTLTVVLTGETAGSLTIVLTGDDSGTTASKSIYVNNSERIYNSGKLGTSAISTEIGGSHTTNGVTWYTNDATMQDSEKEFTVNGNANGVGLGTAAAPVDTFELTSDLFVGTDYANRRSHIISSIIVSSSVAKDGSATLSVYLDGTQIGSTQNLTETLTSYTFTPSSVFAGHITIAIDNDAAKAVNLGSIIVKGVYGGDDESELYYSMAKQLEAIDSCSISESDWNTFLATEDDIELGMTYGEIFEASQSDFEDITLWDHESKDSSSLKTSSFSAFEKYDYIQSRFNGESGLRGLLNKVNTNSTTIIIITISVLSLASLGAFFLLRKKRKEVK